MLLYFIYEQHYEICCFDILPYFLYLSRQISQNAGHHATLILYIVSYLHEYAGTVSSCQMLMNKMLRSDAQLFFRIVGYRPNLSKNSVASLSAN